MVTISAREEGRSVFSSAFPLDRCLDQILVWRGCIVLCSGAGFLTLETRSTFAFLLSTSNLHFFSSTFNSGKISRSIKPRSSEFSTSLMTYKRTGPEIYRIRLHPKLLPQWTLGWRGWKLYGRLPLTLANLLALRVPRKLLRYASYCFPPQAKCSK